MNDNDKRVIALQAALDLASDNAIEVDTGVVRPWTAVDIKNAAEMFFIFLAPESATPSKPKIKVAWRDETPDVVEFARGGAPLPATNGSTPLVSTTVGETSVARFKNPESLREMRARAADERRAQAELDNPTEKF
jgi:hypothetical protein